MCLKILFSWKTTDAASCLDGDGSGFANLRESVQMLSDGQMGKESLIEANVIGVDLGYLWFESTLLTGLYKYIPLSFTLNISYFTLNISYFYLIMLRVE